jgi:hypothetical protein
VVVGYAGARRRSTDLGLTWSPVQTLGPSGDNEFLLRAVTFGAGLFVTVGWRIYTSPDGAVWTQRTNPQNQWLGGIRRHQGVFSAVGGYGYSAWSTDGVSWTASTFRNAEAARTLAASPTQLMAATDPGNWWRSSDGRTWTLDSGGHGSSDVVYCNTQFQTRASCSATVESGSSAFGQGVWVRVRNGAVERSTNGTSWTMVLPNGGFTAVAFGTPP